MSSYSNLKARHDALRDENSAIISDVEKLLETIENRYAGQRGRNPVRLRAKNLRQRISEFTPVT